MQMWIFEKKLIVTCHHVQTMINCSVSDRISPSFGF